MLESLQRRRRGRRLAAVLQAAGLQEPPSPPPEPEPEPEPEPLPAIDPARRSVRTERSSPGRLTQALYSQLTDDDLAEMLSRLSPEDRAAWDRRPVHERPFIALSFSIHYGVPGVAERTRLRPADPPEDVHSMARGSRAAGGAYFAADCMAEGLDAAGFDYAAGRRVLDFGCSSGRVVRVLEAVHPEVEWHGCDPNEPAIRWATQNLPGVEFEVSPQWPPLAYGSESFDAAYAVSVWSHFGERAALAWFDEMRRILKPGGVLVASTQGWHTTHHLAVKELWAQRDVHGALVDLYDTGFSYKDIFGEGGDFGVKDEQWGFAFFSPEWLLTRLTPEWEAVYYRPGRIERNQDLVALRRAR